MEVVRDMARKQSDHEELFSILEIFGFYLLSEGSCRKISSLGVTVLDLHCRKASSKQQRTPWKGMIQRPAHC